MTDGNTNHQDSITGILVGVIALAVAILLAIFWGAGWKSNAGNSNRAVASEALGLSADPVLADRAVKDVDQSGTGVTTTGFQADVPGVGGSDAPGDRLETERFRKELKQLARQRDELKQQLETDSESWADKLGLFQQQLSDRDALVASLNQQVEDRSTKLASTSTLLQQHEDKIGELQSRLESSNRELAERREGLANREAKLKQIEQLLRSNKEQLAELNATVATRDSRIGELTSQLASVNRQSDDDRNQLAASLENENKLRTELKAKSLEASKLADRVTKQQTRVADLQTQVTAARSNLVDLDQQLKAKSATAKRQATELGEFRRLMRHSKAQMTDLETEQAQLTSEHKQSTDRIKTLEDPVGRKHRGGRCIPK